MSSISFIASAQPSTSVTSVNTTAQQSFPTVQSQPSSKSSSNVTISQTATSYSGHEQQIAQLQDGQNVLLGNAISDPKYATGLAYSLSHDNSMIGSPVGGLVNISATATSNSGSTSILNYLR